MKLIKKSFAVLLSLLLMVSAMSISAYAEEEEQIITSTTQPTTVLSKEEAKKQLETQRTDLEKKLKESEEKLKSYGDNAKATEDYINALDEKIGYLNEELTLLDNEVQAAQKNADDLKKQIEPLQKQLDDLKKEYDKAAEEFNALNDSFTSTYNAYCLRLRAMYISGNTSVLAALLTSKDISQFFSRYEMIKAVSKSDTALLKDVNAKMEKIVTKKDGLNERKAKVTKTKTNLDKKQAQYDKDMKTIESKQQEIASKKITLADQRAKSDALLAQYSEENQMYTEFRNEDEKLIAQVDAEIDDLINGLKTPDEVTTADESSLDKKPSSSGDRETGGSLYSASNAVLNLTYPAPGHYAVSQSFGHYRNGKPHTGIDFPCGVGSNIVAAQKGIVITVKRLDYSYGYYIMVYHGTDAKGRKVVTLYAHNSSLLVSVGQSVSKGQVIAKSGSTGNSTGPHCHFELILGGAKTNPKNYLSR